MRHKIQRPLTFTETVARAQTVTQHVFWSDVLTTDHCGNGCNAHADWPSSHCNSAVSPITVPYATEMLKYGRTRSWHRERDWIICVVINECRSNPGVRYYDKSAGKNFKTRLLFLRCNLLWFTSPLLSAMVKNGMATLPQSEEPLMLALSRQNGQRRSIRLSKASGSS